MPRFIQMLDMCAFRANVTRVLQADSWDAILSSAALFILFSSDYSILRL
jgi:hypothetical protein